MLQSDILSSGEAAALSFFEAYDLTLIVIGIGVLGISTLMPRFDNQPFSFPLVALALGWVAFTTISPLVPPQPESHATWAVHLTEVGVIISLMGVGLKIDRSPNLRTWSSVWRLLGVTMVLTITAVALLGWWLLELDPSAALLLGAVMAPTDPVLASDVQVGEPEDAAKGGPTKEREDEVRFALTAEAGLNDSLAFPFTYLALLLAERGTSPSAWLAKWLLIDVGYRIAVGAILGIALGWLLGRILLRLPTDSELQKMRTGVGALSATLLIYGTAEIFGGYGFLAVVIGALTIRHFEQTVQSHRSLHVFADQSEQLVLTSILIGLGAAIAGGLMSSLSASAAIVGLLLIFIVRPAAGMIGLIGCQRLSQLDRIIVSFFGIRGIGSLYYLAYALHKGTFAQEDVLWAVVAFTTVVSVVVHGISAAPVMNFRERRSNADA